MHPLPAEPEADPELERLLLAVLDAPAGDSETALAAACREVPRLADALRRRVAELQRFGLLGADERAAGSDTPTAIGPYRILSVLGHGGMGVVYLAEHAGLGRRVALKCIRPEFLDSERARERFRRETQAIARVQHPGLATLYETGEWQGQPFLAMQFVAGETLEQQLRRARAEGHAGWSSSLAGRAPSTEDKGERGGAVRDAVQLVERLARAVQEAHGAGVVHRDLKPGNVMVTPQGEPVLLDFGLARDLRDEAPALTRSADLVGTPAYMAPEQIEPRGRGVDARTDVHALGVLLYECLTLRPPFLGQGREDTYRRILGTPPVDVQTLQPAAGRDLASVVHRALAKDPRDRFADAAAFADELQRVLRGEPTRTRPAGPVRRTWLWLRQRPALAAAGGTLLVALVVGLAVTVVLLEQARMAIRITEANEAAQHDPVRGAWLAAEALDLGGGEPARSALYAALGEVRLAHTWTYQNSVTAMAMSGDGKVFVTVLWGGHIELWNGDVHKVVGGEHGPQGRPRLAQIDDALQRILIVGEWETALLIDFDGEAMPLDDLTSAERAQLTAAGAERSHARGTIAGAIQGDVVFTASRDGRVLLFDADGERLVDRCFHAKCDGDEWCAAARDPQSGEVAFGSRQGQVVVFTAAGQPRWSRRVGGGAVRFVAFAPDGSALLAATGWKQHWMEIDGFQECSDHVAVVWDRDGHERHRLAGHRDCLTHASWFADSRRVLTSSFDRDVRVWRLGAREKGEPDWCTVMTHQGGVESVVLNPDQQRLFAVVTMDRATMWRVDGTLVAHVTGQSGGAFVGMFAPGGDRLMLSTLDRRLLGFDCASAWCTEFAVPHGAGFARWHTDGHVWAMGNRGQTVVMEVGKTTPVLQLDFETQLETGELVVNGLWLDSRHVAFLTTHNRLLGIDRETKQSSVLDARPGRVSPYGNSWLLRYGERLVRGFAFGGCGRITGGPAPVEFSLHGETTNDAALLTDGHTLATSVWPNVNLFDLRAPDQFVNVKMPDMIWGVAAGADGWAYAGGRDGWFGRLRMERGAPKVETLRRFEHGIPFVAASHDRRMFALGCSDRCVRVVDTRGEVLLTLPRLDDIPWVSASEFSPDDRFLLTASRSGQMHIWPLHLTATGAGILQTSPYQETLQAAKR